MLETLEVMGDGCGAPQIYDNGRFSYAYASSVTTGVASKFSVGGGDGVCHSRPVAFQGLEGAGGPYRIDHQVHQRDEIAHRENGRTGVDMTFRI